LECSTSSRCLVRHLCVLKSLAGCLSQRSTLCLGNVDGLALPPGIGQEPVHRSADDHRGPSEWIAVDPYFETSQEPADRRALSGVHMRNHSRRHWATEQETFLWQVRSRKPRPQAVTPPRPSRFFSQSGTMLKGIAAFCSQCGGGCRPSMKTVLEGAPRMVPPWYLLPHEGNVRPESSAALEVTSLEMLARSDGCLDSTCPVRHVE
jgi:hypothetical protein